MVMVMVMVMGEGIVDEVPARWPKRGYFDRVCLRRATRDTIT